MSLESDEDAPAIQFALNPQTGYAELRAGDRVLATTPYDTPVIARYTGRLFIAFSDYWTDSGVEAGVVYQLTELL